MQIPVRVKFSGKLSKFIAELENTLVRTPSARLLTAMCVNSAIKALLRDNLLVRCLRFSLARSLFAVTENVAELIRERKIGKLKFPQRQ